MTSLLDSVVETAVEVMIVAVVYSSTVAVVADVEAASIFVDVTD